MNVKKQKLGLNHEGGQISFTYTHWFGRHTTERHGPSYGPKMSSLSHCHTNALETKIWKHPLILGVKVTVAAVTSVAHLFGQLVGVEDTRHRHLELVLLLLGLAKSRLSLLQEKICSVLTSKLLQENNSTSSAVMKLKASFSCLDFCALICFHMDSTLTD